MVQGGVTKLGTVKIKIKILRLRIEPSTAHQTILLHSAAGRKSGSRNPRIVSVLR